MEIISQKHDLATSGAGEYDSYRVPGIITTGSGTILVYFEGRSNSQKDNRALLLRYSIDGGKTFSDTKILHESHGKAMVHNPLMIAGLDGEVHMLWNESYSKCFYQKSIDDGMSWTSPRDITHIFEGYRSQYLWTVFAVAPGHGIRMLNGTLVVPIWLSEGTYGHQPACFSSIYSCDNGLTWQRSSIVNSNTLVCDPTEGAIAERSDGSLLATLRHSSPFNRKRAFVSGSIQQWGNTYLHQQLPDPICAGSLLRVNQHKIVFSNCAWEDKPALERIHAGENIRWSEDARQRLSLRFSCDDGQTWSKGTQIEYEGGYSDLASSADGRWVYCFYERGWVDGNCIYNNYLTFLRIKTEDIE
ncbi:sialidase family protein [Petroclostridium sp. X23]|uniref:sialidase family protein n=1 Tax=Petroclostridium sp. X23 TaxID=3045146 RepID=UPI0024AC9A87|nr:sialidase family protein [Petroclostridium sp. X23]WHH59204.1 sialidase family protein [Petroclostridium sp. X23]